MNDCICANSIRAELKRMRKSCNLVIPSSTSYIQDSFLRRHLTHDGLSPEHYRRQKSASLVTMITSLLLLGANHLDLSFALCVMTQLSARTVFWEQRKVK